MFGREEKCCLRKVIGILPGFFFWFMNERKESAKQISSLKKLAILSSQCHAAFSTSVCLPVFAGLVAFRFLHSVLIAMRRTLLLSPHFLPWRDIASVAAPGCCRGRVIASAAAGAAAAVEDVIGLADVSVTLVSALSISRRGDASRARAPRVAGAMAAGR